MDGTFRIAPSNFYQCLVIHTVFLGKTLPIIYILMSGKSEKEYIIILQKIIELTEISAEIIITDFEKPLNNAVKKTFPNSFLQLCYFHFTQSIIRRLKNEGLFNEYKNTEFAIIIKRILASAFF
ncbi:Transposase for insertion sequence element IS256 in transposon [Dictyocoela muelleri]|nr:Transposase for insertion sequence element IS256 in transposon [Dictyocoela muelleri]